MLLLLREFKARESEIAQIYLTATLRVEKLKMDFELSIHIAFEGLFRIKGCYFHFRFILKMFSEISPRK